MIQTFPIHAYEVDERGRLTALALCNYLQELAARHAVELGVGKWAMEKEGLVWVLAKLRVQVHRWPLWSEGEVEIETWPSVIERLLAYREFRIRDTEGAIIAEATSQWVLIDLERRRPVRVPEHVEALLAGTPERDVAGPSPRLRPLKAATKTRAFPVRRFDVDINGHVNNARFAGWVVESVPDDVWTGKSLRTLDIQFKAETFYPGTVASALQPSEEVGTFQHALRDEDGTVLVLAQTQWT
ncbi:MAG: acyl-ACP thioesterase domain-containing protein [Bacteroidota bacterium]